MEPPQSYLKPNGQLWLNHGPIDLFIEAHGTPHEVNHAYQKAQQRFQNLLSQIVEELPKLRLPTGNQKRSWKHEVSARMENACWGFQEYFITPMAAVAGSVADTLLEAMTQGKLNKAYVNNGGDIAVFLSPQAHFSAMIADSPENPQFHRKLHIDSNSAVRGIATSGRGGRSFSMGIADSVTVLAKNAAIADAAATLIANAVDANHPAIFREKAEVLDPDSDLAGKWVTTQVRDLPKTVVHEALEKGRALAEKYHQNGFIEAASLFLQGEQCVFSPESEKGLRFSLLSS